MRSGESHTIRALLAARKRLVGMRRRPENEIRGTLRTFGIRFGKRPGGFARRAGVEVVFLKGRFSPRIRRRCRRSASPSKRSCRHARRSLSRYERSMRGCGPWLAATASAAGSWPIDRGAVDGIGTITALAVHAAIDEPARFRGSATFGAYLGLTPRQCASGEISRSGRISKPGDGLTRTHLLEAAADALLTRGARLSHLKAWGLRLAKKAGFGKAKTAVARKLAVILHAMWKSGTGRDERQRRSSLSTRWQETAAA